MKITPFGDETLLISDMSNQYIDYFSYLKTILDGENNLFYTFSKTIGGDMTGFSAYYLLSPVNILLCLFSQENMPIAITFMTAFKLGLCGLTSSIFFSSLYKDGIGTVFFSTAYALCAYNIAFCFNTMWTDSVYLLPIIALGVNRIIELRKPTVYILSLAAALVLNYYIGYMLCIFSVIYFIYSLTVSWKPLFSDNVKTSIMFGFASVLAGGVSAFTLIPVFLSLDGTKAGINLSHITYLFKFHPLDFFTKLYTGAVSNTQIIAGLPNIFCGLLVSILAFLYFFNSKFSFKNKIAALAVFFTFFISFFFSIIDTVWHGFSPPTWFPYRYSFVFSFFMILVAYHSYQKLTSGVKPLFIFLPLLCFAAYVPVFCKISYRINYLTLKGVISDCAIVAVLSVLLFLLLKNGTKNKKIIYIAIAAVHFISLTVNIYTSLDGITLGRIKHSSFSNHINSTASAVNWVKEYDDSFYRMEKTFSRTLNDPMQFSYNGLSHFSSTEKNATKKFAGDLGLRNDTTWVRYNRGTTMAAESLLGLKYVISKDPIAKEYSLIHSYDDCLFYKNDNALPLAFISNSADIPSANLYSNTFDWQNSIFSAISGISEEIYTPAVVEVIETDNLNSTVSNGYTQYDRADSSNTGYLTYYVTAQSSNPLYLYFYAPERQPALITVNGVSYGKYFDSEQWDALCIGKFQQGETIAVTIETDRDTLFLTGAHFYHENISVLSKHTNAVLMSAENAAVKRISSSHIEWTGNTTEDKTLVFSIPSEKGWHAYIDGIETDIRTVADIMIAVDVPAGNHTVNIKYIPLGIKPGCAVSAICAVLSLLWFMITIKNSKK